MEAAYTNSYVHHAHNKFVAWFSCDVPFSEHLIFPQVEELYLQFARKASSFNTWLEDAEEDLTDPVRCSSLDEVKNLREAHSQFQASLVQVKADFKQMGALDRQIKSYNVSSNP